MSTKPVFNITHNDDCSGWIIQGYDRPLTLEECEELVGRDPKPEEDFDFIKSDHCTECEGKGFETVRGYASNKIDYIDYNEQCEECERLHKLELRADRMIDEAKGN